jgi:hypothetical protein
MGDRMPVAVREYRRRDRGDEQRWNNYDHRYDLSETH